MVGLIVASHGHLAKELINSSYLIFGKQEKVVSVAFEPAEDLQTLKDNYQTTLQAFSKTDQILFLCDLYGGNPMLAATAFVKQDPKRFAAIGGVNLALLLEAYALRESGATLAELTKQLVQIGQSAIATAEPEGDLWK